MRTGIIAVVVLAVALPSSAALVKYKDWGNSPQGYFMTKAERDQWSAISDDGEAEKFVNNFIASRGGEAFTREVATRAQKADQFLTIGKAAGSKSLRGKVIIMFGPPSAMEIADKTKEDNKRDNPMMAGVLSNAHDGPMTGGGRGAEGQTAANALGTARGIRSYHFSFNSVPGHTGTYDVIVDADASSGRDLVTNRRAATELNDLFEAAAKASIKTQP